MSQHNHADWFGLRCFSDISTVSGRKNTSNRTDGNEKLMSRMKSEFAVKVQREPVLTLLETRSTDMLFSPMTFLFIGNLTTTLAPVLGVLQEATFPPTPRIENSSKELVSLMTDKYSLCDT